MPISMTVIMICYNKEVFTYIESPVTGGNIETVEFVSYSCSGSCVVLHLEGNNAMYSVYGTNNTPSPPTVDDKNVYGTQRESP